MSEDASIVLSLHGIVCRLEADRPAFLAFVRRHLSGMFHFEDKPSGKQAAGEAQVFARLHWDAVASPDWINGPRRHWGRRISQSGGRLLQSEVPPVPGLQLETSWLGNTLVLDAYYRPATRLQRVALQFDKFAWVYRALVYYLVYFPLVYFLEQSRGWHLLHAAAVSYSPGDSPVDARAAEDIPAPGCLLAGLPGSGKTTFALSLLSDRRLRLLSDNLVLFDSSLVYALPEAIHVSRSSRDKLTSAVQDLLQETGRGDGSGRVSYERHEYQLPASARQAQAVPQALFFLGLAGETYSAPLTCAAAMDRLSTFDQLSKEMIAYTQFAAALNLISPQRSGAGASYGLHKRSILERLVSNLACFELWLPRNVPLEEAISTVRQVLVQKV